MIINFLLEDKLYRIFNEKRKRISIYKNDNLILFGHYLKELKYLYLQDYYQIIVNSSKLYYKNIIFQIIKFDKILNINSFFSAKSIVVIFEDTCSKSKKMQEKIVSYFTEKHYSNISSIYVIQSFFDYLSII